RLELAANLLRRVRLHVDHVLRGGAAEQVEQDDAFRLARQGFALPDFLGLKESRQSEAASEEAQGAGRQRFAPRQAIAGPSWTAQHGDHVNGPPSTLPAGGLKTGMMVHLKG